MLKLMIVDDSNIIRRKIERTQKKSRKFELIASASNGAEAVSMFKKFQPDVVTMDLTMPQMNGIECIKQLIAINPDILILVVSALSDKATGIEALELGARGYLCKPFTEEVLIDALQELTEDVYV
ncbi:MAG: two-component system chemotaxis response regulator CheY [Candidatus Endobugula sp.]|jgi:two-component system chemotaxis response regulator CheY